MTLKVLIVDDEKWGRENLQNLITQYCEGIEIIGKATNVDEAVIFIKEQQPDVVFLDIRMPKKDGFVLLEEIEQRNFSVIFVTAYDRYALQAIKFSAIDYLLKPISIKELVSAVEKVSALHKAKIKNQQILANYQRSIQLLRENLQDEQKLNHLTLTNNDGMHILPISSIIRFEADDNYTAVHISDKDPILIAKTIKYFEEILVEQDFMRIHKSHIVNFAHVKEYLKREKGEIVTSDGVKVSLARRRQKDFFEKLNVYLGRV